MVKNVTSSAEQALSESKKECLHLLVWLAGVYSNQLALFHGFHCNLSHLRHCAQSAVPGTRTTSIMSAAKFEKLS